VFAGHYSAAFAAKAASPATPLWVLLLAAQLVDVFWVIFILTGVEKAGLDATLGSNPLVLHHMPWTHSLVGTFGWAALAFVAVRSRLGLGAREATLVAVVVVSHWFLDLVVHRPDLTLAGGDARLGMSLWNLPIAAWALEEVLVVAGVALAMRACARGEAGRRAWLLLGGGLVLLQAFTSFGPLPPSLTAMVATTFVVYFVVAAAGAAVDRADRRREALPLDVFGHSA